MLSYQSKYAYGLSFALLASLIGGCSEDAKSEIESEGAVKPKAPVVTENVKPNVIPALALDLLPDVKSNAAAIDYIIDGSASMCGYFNAELNKTEQAIPITKLVQAIQAVRRTDDRILVFMQDKSADKASYLEFEQFENQLMQGECQLNGQYTQLGLILQDYREQPELQKRSVAIISDMHLLPAERTVFDTQYDALLSAYVTPENKGSAISNGLLSLRSPFVGTYYTVNNATKTLEQTQKHLHFFWLAKQPADAKQVEKIQQSISSAQNQYPNSVIAQAEFLPQVKLLTNKAKNYESFSSPAPIVIPKSILDLSMQDRKPYLSAFDANSSLSDEQKSCYDIGWNENNSIYFHPYPNSKTNRDKICPDGPLFRSKTGSTLRLNLPLQSGYSINPKTPSSLEVVDNYLSIPIIDAQKACIGVSSGIDTDQKIAQSVSLQYAGDNKNINTDYYAQYSIERDGCTSDSDCSNLVDKTFQYNQLVSSLANKSKQHIESLYPRTIDIALICDAKE